MKTTTICFLLKDDEILLAMKKRGFGVGKWNGVGGKVNEGESVEDAAIREIKEEIGVAVDRSNLQNFGTLKFSFEDNHEWDNFCHIFLIRHWSGELSESEEMRPKWFKANELPFSEMWIDDPLWLPRVLAGEKIEAAFAFGEKGLKLNEAIFSSFEKGNIL